MTLHQFIGTWGQACRWSGARVRKYATKEAKGVMETWLIGKAEHAENFAMRYYEIAANGHSRQESHSHDHGILVLQGMGQVQVEKDLLEISRGDVLYIPPDTLHQIINVDQEPLGFICVIPAKRKKQGESVWAEEGLSGLEMT